MDLKIRQFFDEIIALVNSYNDIPLEARRLALESAMYSCERAANKAIQQQNQEESERLTKELAQMVQPDINEGSDNSMEDESCKNLTQE